MSELTRREFMELAALTAASASVGSAIPLRAAVPPKGRVNTGYNILFVFSDQERYFPAWPQGLTLPGHARLASSGVTFHNHYCPAVMCTSSRSVMVTGLQTADSRMFENADMPYVKPLSANIPTVGHMLRKAGYYTAYKGKWHLNADFDRDQPDKLFTNEMDAYGFSDYVWPGDLIAHTLGGFNFDHVIAGTAVSWLRRKGRALTDEKKPWALFVSMVNPHDIMYFNTDAPGENVQDNGRLMMHAARAPRHEMFRAKWNAPLPKSLTQPLNAPARPAAHAEFMRSWGYMLGNVPIEESRWQRFSDYYLNCIRAVDLQLSAILSELDSLGLSENTIVVYTADHGEMAGAHGLRGKGPFAYEEITHLPMYVVHPDVRGGQNCHALTGHIDLVPSLLSMAGVNAAKANEFASHDLAGKDFTTVLNDPEKADVHAVRDGVLFTYSGIATNDSEVIRLISDAKAAGQDPKAAIKASGYKPNLKKRGSLRTVFDGRYKFTRYFAPVDRNRPANVDEVYRWNDVELFDLKTDPGEMTNLAADRTANASLVSAMSEKLEKLIKAEIGVDDGREMPEFGNISWTLDRMDL